LARNGPAVSGSLAGTISASTGQAAVAVAEQQIGKPYQWGGAGPDTFDCSGLVMWSYDQVGVHIDHWTGDQWNEGAHISQSKLRPGDLIFFAYDTSRPSTIHHVGMYIGNGQMVEAPYTGANGTAIRDIHGGGAPWVIADLRRWIAADPPEVPRRGRQRSFPAIFRPFRTWHAGC